MVIAKKYQQLTYTEQVYHTAPFTKLSSFLFLIGLHSYRFFKMGQAILKLYSSKRHICINFSYYYNQQKLIILIYYLWNHQEEMRKAYKQVVLYACEIKFIS